VLLDDRDERPGREVCGCRSRGISRAGDRRQEDAGGRRCRRASPRRLRGGAAWRPKTC
jgi:hypothetical protein